MAHCKYHPLESATYNCAHCGTTVCDNCTGELDKNGQPECLLCEKKLQSLGTAGSAEPFWRRLQESFRYPLNWNAMPIIIAVALITSILSAIPLFWLFAAIIYLALVGALFKYSFLCLERTSEGEMSAPPAHDAYSGGLSLLIKLILMLMIAGGSIAALANFFGAAIAGLASTLFIISLPAILIRFAQTDDIADALNPINALSLITAIGLPYGLLIAFILIMTSSVGVIHELIGSRLSILSVVLQSVVSNYYTVVIFHIMGYMLYQYQEKLGYAARADNLENTREELDILKSKIDVNLKEGYYEKVIDLSEEGIKRYPRNRDLAQNFFNFSINTHRPELVEISANHFLNLLFDHQEYDKLNIVYAQTRKVAPQLVPSKPKVRLQLAKICQTKGDAKSAVHLLNGLGKAHPDFNDLAEVFTTLAEALTDLNLIDKAEVCRKRAEELNRKKQTTKNKTTITERFSSRELSTSSLATPMERNPAISPDTTGPRSLSPNESESAKPKELPPIEFKP